MLYFLATGFLEPPHTTIAIAYLADVRDGPCGADRLFVGGAVVSVVGMTDVFVATDLSFLGTTAQALKAANRT